jgi:ABC-type amino acid transport system permease subunit
MNQLFETFGAGVQALRNNFVALVEDSSLVSVLGVLDVTQAGKGTAAGNFRYFVTYNIVALIYLTVTIGLSRALRRLIAICATRPRASRYISAPRCWTSARERLPSLQRRSS